jgi:hypothetical protein
MSPRFERYIGIDYSGAQTPRSSLKGLRVYLGDHLNTPQEVLPPPSPRKYWTRRGIAEWLVEKLSEGQPILVGIDHGFSFPLRYFEQSPSLNWNFMLRSSLTCVIPAKTAFLKSSGTRINTGDFNVRA